MSTNPPNPFVCQYCDRSTPLVKTKCAKLCCVWCFINKGRCSCGSHLDDDHVLMVPPGKYSSAYVAEFKSVWDDRAKCYQLVSLFD
jgi:hypothetical protein